MALNVSSRTLRAEVDLPNPGGRILPGMYAYGKVEIERKDVWALPVSALMHLGDNTILRVGQRAFCWLYKDGQSIRLELETGVVGDPDPNSGERWIEVTNRRVAGFDSAASAAHPGRRLMGRSKSSWATCRSSPMGARCNLLLSRRRRRLRQRGLVDSRRRSRPLNRREFRRKAADMAFLRGGVITTKFSMIAVSASVGRRWRTIAHGR